MNKLKTISLVWKLFVWIDWTIRAKRFPKSIELTDRRDIVRIDGILCGFYSKEFVHYEICEEFPDDNINNS